MSWDPQKLPDQSGKTFVVTGANAGLGYFISEQLAGAGARIVLACRNAQRADAAMAAIRARVPAAQLESIALDTADPESVRGAARDILALGRLDGLIENAGQTSPGKHREQAADGNEIVLATNVLGHFALAALVLPALAETPGSRLVTMGSMASRLSSFLVDDLQLTEHYSSWRAYAQSKIALQSFGFELDRRLRAAGSSVASIVAHPGYAVGGLAPQVPGVNEQSSGARFGDRAQGAFGAQGKDRGAWPAVRAAVDPDAEGGQFWGPRFLMRGMPTLQKAPASSTDPAIAQRVWSFAEEFTSQSFVV